MVARLLRPAADILVDADRFIRLHYVGFPALLVLTGAFTSQPELTAGRAAPLLAVALLFNVFSYVSNDLIDLPIDRLQPRRTRDPLVRGAVSERSAWTIALAALPLSLLITTAAQSPTACLFTLAVSYSGMAIYNLWGKRVSFPLATDLIEGIAWGALAGFGVCFAGGVANVSTFAVAAYGVFFIFLINGIHGGLRDLVNDLRCGKTTSAIMLGARPGDGEEVVSSKAIIAFSFVVHAVLILLLATAVIDGRSRYGTASLALAVAVVVIGASVSSWLLWQVVKPRNPHRDRPIGHHLFILILMPVAIFGLQMPTPLSGLLVGSFLLPFLATDDVAGRIGRKYSRLGEADGSCD